MIRFITMKIYDNTFKTTLTRKGSEVIVIAIKISSASYIVLNWYLLGVEMNLPNAHKTRFWHLLGVFSKMPDEHPRHFIREYPPAWFTVHNAKNPAPEGQSSYLSRPYKQASFLTTRRWNFKSLVHISTFLKTENFFSIFEKITRAHVAYSVVFANPNKNADIW